MTFHDIIEQNMKKCSVKWWPNYAYHFTDVNNAVNIIKQGFLYSRTIAKEKRLMINDNASRKVIEMTSGEISDFVRFYFRPLTPTQYNNEGFKHSAIRYDKDPFANVPVPIFFFFWLEPLLKNPNTLFTGSSAAGGVTEKKRGLEQFCSLEFENIYANGPYTSEIPEVKKRETELRQAEILYPSKYPIRETLAGIVCRNEVERNTFLNLIRQESQELFLEVQPKTKILRDSIYYNNGLFIEDCIYHDRVFAVVFSEYYKRNRFVQRHLKKETLVPINSHIVFEWVGEKKEERLLINRREFQLNLDYLRKEPIRFIGMPIIPEANLLKVTVFFEQCLMCYQEYSLLNGEIL